MTARTLIVVRDTIAMHHIANSLIGISYVSITTHSDSAIFMAYEYKPNIIIIDVGMPGIDIITFNNTIKSCLTRLDLIVVFSPCDSEMALRYFTWVAGVPACPRSDR